MNNIKGVAHVGVRVAEFKRSIYFYRNLGFELIREDMQERVCALKHPSGAVINLLDSSDDDNGGRNILMDVCEKFPGYTHLALAVGDIALAESEIRNLQIAITEGPVTFGDGSTSIFLRDPDRNVIELSQPFKIVKKTRDTAYTLQVEGSK